MIKQNEGLYNEQEIRRTVQTLIPQGNVFEVRVIRSDKKIPMTGYFKSASDVIKAFDTVDLRNTNVYLTYNELDEACDSMSQFNKFIAGAPSTGDADVKNLLWLFVDVDPERKTGVSATDKERDAAFDMAKRVVTFLENHNFPEPIKAVSGNGAHLLYRIALKNTAENRDIVANCLNALDMLFTDDEVKIDTVNANPSRVCKLYGTMAQKGTSTKSRPHRMSRMFYVPEQLKVVPKVNLEWLADQFPKEEPQQQRSANSWQHEEFDVERWLSEHGFNFEKKQWKNGIKYVLDVCPYDSTHTAPDASIIKLNSGAITFKCFHNSCQNHTWKELRSAYEPDYQNRADREAQKITSGWTSGWQQHKRQVFESAEIATEEKGETFFDMQSIMNRKEPDAEYLATGIKGIDEKMKGLQKGCISVLSGLRGSAKSTFLSQLMLEMVNNEKTVVCYSGELSCKNFFKWLMLQAAGNKHVLPMTKFHNAFTVDSDETVRRIAEWLGDKLWLFNNDYGNNADFLVDALEKQVKKVNADIVVLDNLMAVDLGGRDFDKYEAQTRFIWTLKHLAKSCDIHVIFVAHPRKVSGFLRLNDIAGSGNIGNIVDNAFIIHRSNDDFKKSVAEHLGKEVYHRIDDTCNNVIEICKDRENGTQDEFIPLWYEMKTKRLLPSLLPNDYRHYKWETTAAVEKTVDSDDDNDNPF